MSEITLENLAKHQAADTSSVTDVNEVEVMAQVNQAVSDLSPEDRERVEKIKSEIDLLDTQQTVQYGVGVQRNIADFSDHILGTVKSKDAGDVGKLMSDLSVQVKEMGIDQMESSFLDKLPFFNSAKRSLDRFIARYETVEVNIDHIEGELDKTRMELLKDIHLFDTLYEKNLEYFHDLEVYIRAGEELLKEMHEETLPKLHAEAEAKGDTMSAQLVSDFENKVNRFEKKVHDLKLSKTIALQSAPQIRLVQNNDKLLVEKIQTAILNTIPLWKSQIVITLGLQKQEQALKLQREVTDTTNRLLEQNAALLKENTADVAQESERGIVDLETLKRVNQDLIDTIDETIQIQRNGAKARKQAEVELQQIEQQLQTSLLQLAITSDPQMRSCCLALATLWCSLL